MNTKLIPPGLPDASQEDNSQEIIAFVNRLKNTIRQQHLDAAVKLAIDAANGQGELIEHFVELGKRFGYIKHAKPKRVSYLRLVK